MPAHPGLKSVVITTRTIPDVVIADSATEVSPGLAIRPFPQAGLDIVQPPETRSDRSGNSQP